MDDEALWALAERLHGHPVPGLRMTGKEFEAWCREDVRAEWVNGEVILVPPANDEHDDLNVWLIALLRTFVEAKDLGAIRTNILVRLPRQRRRRVPDLLFVAKARTDLLRLTYLDGAPDLAIEITSPDSVSRDVRDKYFDYEKAGVREYWIINPMVQRLEAHRLGRDKKYHPSADRQGRIASAVLRGFFLRPEWLSSRPRLQIVLREWGVREK
jgi:Uma2 family endonuclease